MHNKLSRFLRKNIIFMSLLGIVSSGVFSMHSKLRPSDFELFIELYEPEQLSENPRNAEVLANGEQALSSLFTAAQKRNRDAMLYLDTHKPNIISSLITLKRNNRDLLSRLREKGNSFASLFMLYSTANPTDYQCRTWCDELERDNNPAYAGMLAKKATNNEEALKYYDKAIAQGYVPSIYDKIFLLFKMNNQESRTKAFTLLRECAAAWDGFSMNLLASKLKQHPEFSLHSNEYLDWYRRAAEAGVIEAMANLSTFLILNGEIEEAKIYLAKARLSNAKKLETNTIELIKNNETLIIELENSGNVTKARKVSFVGDFKISIAEEIYSNNPKAFIKHLRDTRLTLIKFLTAMREVESELELSESEECIEGDNSEALMCLNQATVDVIGLEAKKDEEESKIQDQALKQPISESSDAAPILPVNKSQIESRKCKEKKTKKSIGNDSSSSSMQPVPEKITLPTNNHDEPGFIKELAHRLLKVQDIVEDILNKKSITNKNLRILLNALKTENPTNTAGSHNSMKIVLDQNHRSKKTVITNHKNSSPHTNSAKIRQVFNEFGIFSSTQLWHS